MTTRSEEMPEIGRLWRPNTFDIDLGAISHNVYQVRGLIGDAIKLVVALKADAYGYGVREVAHEVVAAGADGLAMVNASDAIELRQDGLAVPILLYPGHRIDRQLVELAEAHNLMVTIASREDVAVCASAARHRVRTFIKVEVGLERLGVLPEEAVELAREVSRTPRLGLQGLYAHVHVPEAPQVDAYVDWQLARLANAISQLDARGVAVRESMAASSAVLRIGRGVAFTSVDPGHVIYGLVPDGPATFELDLRSAFNSLKSELILTKAIRRDEYSDLSPASITDGMRVGIIPLGWADGLSSLTTGEVLVRGQRARLLGNPSLEHTRVDITQIPAASVGDEVVIIGTQGGERITPDEVRAHHAHRAAALAPSVGQAVRRRYVRNLSDG